ncbi:type 1 glutamine amidotransferase domain-containing protein [Nocardioides aquiterrae]|uniref:Type 1 glutamine amidotransferase domain-containing protein n=1 Tax=Nocardioides aquiterrae TaxID=203799 RepID=A0ABN1U7Y2_9ACTN
MSIQGKRIALMIEDDYQILEGWYPYLRLTEAGAVVTVVGNGEKKSFSSKEHYPMEADTSPGEVTADDFDGVVVPGGFAPDNMRLHRPMIDLVRDIAAQGKMTASICHGGWILASADAVRGRRVTGYAPIEDDLVNAGATWVSDEPAVVDGHIITARTPPDLPDFLKAIVAYFDR